MPVSSLPNRRAFDFDKAMELRDRTLAAIAADQIESGIPFVATTFDLFKVIVGNDFYTGWALGTAEWTVTVQASATLAGTYLPVGSVKLNGTTPTPQELALSGKEIEQIVPGAKFLRVSATKAGSVGALTYYAFVSPKH